MSLELANKRIDDAINSGDTFLDLSICELGQHEPREIGRLFTRINKNLPDLTALYLHGNQLSALPPELGQLTALATLYLDGNQLSALPPELGQLTALTELYLDDNQLSALPPELGQLTALTGLYLSGNQLSSLPPELGQLTALTGLYLSGNQLSSLPPELGQLTALTTLYLNANQLSSLPPELGQLTALTELYLDGNPLDEPPPEVISQGTGAILKYLREKSTESARQWTSKMLVVGEGGVGKTQLISSLMEKEFETESGTTFGIDIAPWQITHPKENDCQLTLKVWDFGGQTIYHATHQFFLTNRSLFVLVWNARYGYAKCDVVKWLDTIELLAPDSPVMIVATHVDERPEADLPFEDLKKKYPQIVGEWWVSNRERNLKDGIDNLRKAVIENALELPLMGNEWPKSWLDAGKLVREKAESKKKVTLKQLCDILTDAGVPSDSHPTVAKLLHELGDILYFDDDDELKEHVILNPHWVTQRISDILVSDLVEKKVGILTTEAMNQIWIDSDIDASMANRLLRLMERFDLSYRIPDDFEDRSLIVQKLDEDPADYRDVWDAHLDTPGCKEITMKFDLTQTKPAGIPTWFIARSHRFTQTLHWLHGALFGSPRKEPKHLALVLSPVGETYLTITVRGPSPHSFFSLLKDGLELTLDRFEGLKDKLVRTVPCPDPSDIDCNHEFDFALLENRIAREKPKPTIECPKCLEDVSVNEMLYGISPVTEQKVIDRIDVLEVSLKEHGDENTDKIISELDELRELSQRQFLLTYNAFQRLLESQTPRVFTLRPENRATWKARLFGTKWKLQLYCEAPGCWHPSCEPQDEDQKGLYTIKDNDTFFQKAAPWIRRLVTVLKYTAPLGTTIACAVEDVNKLIKDDIKLMGELIKILPIGKDDIITEHLQEVARDEFRRKLPSRYGDLHRESLSELRKLMISLDKEGVEAGEMGGLRKVMTPEGHWLWLCPRHREEVQA